MTELQIFLTFLINLPGYPGKRQDVERFSKRLETIIRHSDWDSASELAHSLLSFDDAIVTGLNDFGITECSFPALSNYPQSVLPKFLFGLTSQVFDPVSGRLNLEFPLEIVDLLLTGLRLVRRCSIKTLAKRADDLAIMEFRDAQLDTPAYPLEDLVEPMTDCWEHFLENFDENITLGFPGNGVTSDMDFGTSGYVPKMSFVNPDTLPSPIRLTMYSAVQRFLPDYDITSPCPFIKLYNYVPFTDRIVSVVSVPKSFKIGRAITVTNTASVIIGATLRETIWSCARQLGVLHIMNVHDQSRSHRILKEHFHNRFFRDLKGGSTCYSVQRQLRYLSRCRRAKALFEFSRPNFCRSKFGEFPINTLTMGDASCTALLTSNLFLSAVLTVAYAYLVPFGSRITRDTFVRSISIIKENPDWFAFVGDDVIGPSHLSLLFDKVLDLQEVVINHRKSSQPESLHKETCGAWVISNGIQTILREIFPFRAASSSKDLLSDLATLHASLKRSLKSAFSTELLIAQSEVLSHQLEYLNTNGYTENHIGSPIGVQQLPRVIRPARRHVVTVPDDIAYAFGLPDSRCSPRVSKRPVLERGRISKYRDLSLPSFVSCCKDQAKYTIDAASIPLGGIFAQALITGLAFFHVNRQPMVILI